MKSVLALSAAVAFGLAAGLAMLVWWLPTILLLRSRLAPHPAPGTPRAARGHRSLARGDVAAAERILARLALEAGTGDRPGRAQDRFNGP